MSDLISRQTVLRCIKESRDNIDWGQSEDGDAFLHYTGALYRTIASEECLPSAEPQIIRCKDCKWWERETEDSPMGYCHACKHGHYSRHWEIHIIRTYKENFFCADAEKKEEE